MAGITLEQAETALAQALDAHAKATIAQKYEVHSGQSSRVMDRARLDHLLVTIQYWDSMVKQLSNRAAGRGRSRTVVVGG